MYKRIFFLLAILSQITFAQSELSFDFDYARFNYDTSSVFLEFYYNLNSRGMVTVETQSGKLSEAIVHIEMKNTATDSFYINKDWKIQNVIAKTDSVGENKNLSGVFGFTIPEGDYSLLLKVWDANNNKLSKTINENIRIHIYDHKFYISDIELASNIKKDDADPKSLFYKNTLEVIPNPSMVYTNQNPILFYYTELYGLKMDSSNQAFDFQKILYNGAGTQVYKNSKDVKQNPMAVVDYGLINLSKYPTDTYSLVLSLINPKTKEAFVSTKKFYLVNPNVKDTTSTKKLNVGMFNSEFAIMTEEECDKMFDEIKYISTANEIKQYKSVDSLNAKQTFLYNFWKNRDTDLSTDRNEFKEEYLRQVDYTIEHFSVGGRPGYLTDRGRVLLIYGEPDQRDYFPNESNIKPYETWFYNQIEGGVQFIFGDITGFGNYMLLHSTKRGEISDTNWKDRISAQ